MGLLWRRRVLVTISNMESSDLKRGNAMGGENAPSRVDRDKGWGDEKSKPLSSSIKQSMEGGSR